MKRRRALTPAELRQGAERRLQSEPPASGQQQSVLQMQRLVHELQVHQVELEMQNEELRESRAEVEAGLARYTDLYDFAPVGYFTLTPDGTIRGLNLPGALLLGVARGNLVGRGFATHISAKTRADFDAWLVDVFTTPGSHTCTVVLSKAGPRPTVVELQATLSVDGQEASVVAVDATERHTLEAQLLQAQKMDVVGQLAGGVAHDFNNILAAMLLNLGLLQQQLRLPEEARAALQGLETLAKRASSLTSQLLLFSRRQNMLTQRVELNGALTHLLEMVKRLLGEEITHERVGAELELWVDADTAMLEQTVMNLCLNARDAMPRGGTLTLETSVLEFDVASLRAHPEARPGRFACLRISDTGCGMAPEVLKHLFEPFFTTKELGKGTGLGLSSAYGVVHQHKGWLGVESALGRGTTFRLYLPLSHRGDAVLPTLLQLSDSKRKRQTILLVEDEPELLRAGVRAMNQFGYSVIPAVDGVQALEIWEQHQGIIDLLMTDMRMPRGVTGLQLADRLLLTKPSLKVIIMSGHIEGVGDGSGRRQANYGFLGKPFDLRELANAVHRSLGDEPCVPTPPTE